MTTPVSVEIVRDMNSVLTSSYRGRLTISFVCFNEMIKSIILCLLLSRNTLFYV